MKKWGIKIGGLVVDMMTFLVNLILYGFLLGTNEFLAKEYPDYRVLPLLAFIVYLLLMRFLIVNSMPAEKYLKEYWD